MQKRTKERENASTGGSGSSGGGVTVIESVIHVPIISKISKGNSSSSSLNSGRTSISDSNSDDFSQ